jgi:hypothetical protein
MKDELRVTGDLSFLWSSDSLEEESGMLTYVLNDHYDTPPIIRRKNSREYCWNGKADEVSKVKVCAEKFVELIT